MILSTKEKDKIISLYFSGKYTEYELAKLFKVAQSTLSYVIQDSKIQNLLSKVENNELESIRSIKNLRERLIKSTKLAASLNIINKRIIARIAQLNDFMINKLFKTFLNLLIKSNVYNGNAYFYKDVNFSKYDVNRNIRLPEKITPQIGEFAGIHAGDGSAFITHNYKKNSIGYNIRVSGHTVDEKDYYDNIVAPLYSKIFNINIQPKFLKENEYGFAISSKAIFSFVTEILEFPIGEKSKILVIPKPIKEAGEEVVNSFIRGLFDTDGYFHFRYHNSYPVFQITSASKWLISQLKTELLNRGFNNISCNEANPRVFRITVQGRENLKLWRQTIGTFHSQKHETKYLLWEKFGLCPFNTTTPERQKLMNLNINSFSGRFV